MILYRIGIISLNLGIKLSSLFVPKNKLLLTGLRVINKEIKSDSIWKNDFVVWIHSASLGEFEQARPIIEGIKTNYPKHKILVSFFSPSGYEIRKNYPLADKVCYLPLDTKENAHAFINHFNPNIALFIKYEFWYFFFEACKKNKIPLFSVSSIFRPNQRFFTNNIASNKVLNFVEHFFVQNTESQNLLHSINIKNQTLSGDTRFDRVLELSKQTHDLGLIKDFCKHPLTLVIGSSWHHDIAVLKDFIESSREINIIIAPHEVDKNSVHSLQKSIESSSILLSDLNEENAKKSSILIVDCIGKLNSIYSIASIAYVGGGLGSGLHNILEPATYGIPVVFGGQYKKFQEAIDLVQLGGAFNIQNAEECSERLNSLIASSENRSFAGAINKKYIQENAGACNSILSHLTPYLSNES